MFRVVVMGGNAGGLLREVGSIEFSAKRGMDGGIQLGNPIEQVRVYGSIPESTADSIRERLEIGHVSGRVGGYTWHLEKFAAAR
jgi:hypothetical protein